MVEYVRIYGNGNCREAAEAREPIQSQHRLLLLLLLLLL